jgi:hypothetical protein
MHRRRGGARLRLPSMARCALDVMYAPRRMGVPCERGDPPQWLELFDRLALVRNACRYSSAGLGRTRGCPTQGAGSIRQWTAHRDLEGAFCAVVTAHQRCTARGLSPNASVPPRPERREWVAPPRHPAEAPGEPQADDQPLCQRAPPFGSPRLDEMGRMRFGSARLARLV